MYEDKKIAVNKNSGFTPVQRIAGKGKVTLQDNRPESLVQRKQLSAKTGTTDNEPVIQQKVNTTGLPDNLKSGIENLSGHSMDDVKVHYNSAQPAQLNAHAYAQGTAIHIAPGQEKYLPHEAWHVVQQKQGRVKPTMQMKGKVNVNDDKALEKEADIMGDKAIRQKTDVPAPSSIFRTTGTASPTAQLKNAHQAGHLANYVQGANTDLYNIPARVILTQGNLYSRLLVPAPDVAGVLNAYMLEARNAATQFIGLTFLDKNEGPPNVPGLAAWHVQRVQYLTDLAAWIRSAPAVTAGFNRPQAVNFVNDLLLPNRQQARNNINIGLIDPFVLKVTIPQAGTGNWIIQTNFSESALGYITSIHVGSKHVTGHIAANPAAFNLVAPHIPAAAAFQYSPAHHTGTVHTVGEQINAIGPGLSNHANHEGFDAVAKLGAEGARFEPVRELGLALKVNSRFYAVDANNGQTKFLSFLQLYQNWGEWFHRGYGITAAAILAEVIAHGTVFNAAIDRVHDYDLDNSAPASTMAANYTAIITRHLHEISNCKNRKLKFASQGRKSKNRQKAIADYNRGQNRQIEINKFYLRPYQRMYPDMYEAVKNPPLPVVVLPAQANSNGRTLVVGAVVLAGLLIVGTLGSYLYGDAGLLSPGSNETNH